MRFISDLRGPTQQIVGQGAFVYENTLGGRVAVVPWDASVDTTPMMDIHRATQIRRIVAWLAAAGSVGWVDGGPWLVPQFLVDRGGKLADAALSGTPARMKSVQSTSIGPRACRQLARRGISPPQEGGWPRKLTAM